MALELTCDISRRKILGDDAGAGPMIVEHRTDEGPVRVRIEVLPRADGTRWNLRTATLQRIVENGELVPEDSPDDVTPIGAKRKEA